MQCNFDLNMHYVSNGHVFNNWYRTLSHSNIKNHSRKKSSHSIPSPLSSTGPCPFLIHFTPATRTITCFICGQPSWRATRTTCLCWKSVVPPSVPCTWTRLRSVAVFVIIIATSIIALDRASGGCEVSGAAQLCFLYITVYRCFGKLSNWPRVSARTCGCYYACTFT